MDQATAVFSVRDVAEAKTGSETADESGTTDAETGTAGAESGSDAESAAASGNGSGSGGAAAKDDGDAEPAPAEEAGDARLRAAVAAWVSSGPDDDAEGGDGDSGRGDAERGDAAGSGDGDGDGGRAGADVAGGADADADSGDAPGAEGETEAAPSGGAASKPAVAEDGEPEPTAGGDSASSDDAESEPSSADDADAEPVAAAAAGSEGVAPESAVAGPAKGAEAAETAPGEPEDAKPVEAAEPAGDAKPAQDVEEAEDAESDDAPADSTPEDSTPEDGASEAKAAKPDADDKPDAAKPATAGDERGVKGGWPKVDQPTAVFKAPVPPVDQPTTMLKSPAAKDPAKAGPDAGAKAGSKDAAQDSAAKDRPAKGGAAKADETEAERTSRFVPLRTLDSRTGPAPDTARPAEQPAPERTTQQPLPPKPPLDLLAELTNTPPPPETRVRTTVRRFKIWTPLVLLLIVVFAVVQVVRPLPDPTLELTAQESVSFEGGKPSVPWPGQGQAAMDVNGIGTFGTSGDQKPVPIASIAKVMTVYLVLRDHPMKTGEKGENIPVDAAAEKHYETGKAGNESVVRVSEGQKITEYEALQAVMLPSANNVAKLLARWDTGESSESAFVEKMNKTAKELGMKNTTYTDPSGLDKTTVSTAEDLVKLGRAAMENPVFKEISRQPSYVDLNGEKQTNFFGLVPTVAIGIKTGTTTAAGGNILFAAEKQVGGKTQTIIGAALGQYGRNGTANIDEVTGVVRKLIESGQSALTAKTIVKKGDVVGRVDDGLGGTTPVVATKDVSAVGWSGLTVRLQLDGKKGETIPHTAKAGTEVGVLSVGDGKNDAVEVPVALQKDLAEPGFGAKIKRVA
ncbi:D-alanyl-D-alanine carboxypeptidase [Streptomyces kunmingensis]|uniref:D-alanyl-D-alanine carboxypeptidase n=1 Tax=Streptomyces kunmingensis TaxID=68225 RepID=UPI002D76B1F3|nr:D-alanyl-D-alanine carboxypeptidase [Streptomyces kunmingensis]